MNEKVLGIRSLWWKEMLTFFVFEKVHRCYHSWCSTPKSNANAWADTHKKILEEGSVQITRFSWRLRNHSNQWRTQKLFMCGGVSCSGVWWSFVFGVRSLWRHSLASYSCLHLNAYFGANKTFSCIMHTGSVYWWNTTISKMILFL